VSVFDSIIDFGTFYGGDYAESGPRGLGPASPYFIFIS